jgi:hypothetical protein
VILAHSSDFRKYLLSITDDTDLPGAHRISSRTVRKHGRMRDAPRSR